MVTLGNKGPVPFGGTIFDFLLLGTGGKVGTWNSTADLSGFVALALLDLPLSLAADIALLPIAFPWMFLFG
tara:strand:- start:287 stop:499 length:213 start_codon:yes stop_codon:yes gene_type:complete